MGHTSAAAVPLSRPARIAVAAVLALALGARLLGIFVPEPTTDGEIRLAQGVAEPEFKKEKPRARFYPHVIETRPLLALGFSPARAAYVQHALVGLAALLLAALVCARLFGRRAGWCCLALGALSTLDLNYSTKVMGIPHAGLFLAASILCFTSRHRLLWGLGGMLLALAFCHRYHAGLVVLSFAGAIVWDDLARARRHGWRSALWPVVDRIWVGAIAAVTLVLYLWWVGEVYGRSQFSRLFEHENLSGVKLSGTIVHSNFLWLRALFRLDPAVWSAIAVAVVLSLRSARGFWSGAMSTDPDGRFAGPSLVIRWAILLVAALLLFRTLSGMTRQIFPGMPVFLIAGGAVIAHVWGVLADWRGARALIVAAAGVALVVQVAAARELYVTKGRHPRAAEVAERLGAAFPGRRIERFDYGSHFLWQTGGFRRVRKLARVPDVIVGGDQLLPFFRFEEEPAKIQTIEQRIEQHKVGDHVGVRDIIYTTQFYVTPPPTTDELEAFHDRLPLRLRWSSRVRQ